MNREQRIREEAHLLWNADGCPEGKAEDYWLAAQKVIDHQDRLAMEEDRRGTMWRVHILGAGAERKSGMAD